MKPIVFWGLVAGTAGLAGLAYAGWRFLGPHRDGYEEPAFTVQASHDGFEVRRYEPTIEAQVTVSGTRQQANQVGFRILAGYIFGGNTGKSEIAMTTPVSAEPSSQTIDMTPPVSAKPASQTIDMTTPVSAIEGDQGWTIAFTMPSKWTLATLPVPDDARVKLVEVPGKRAAVRAFSGWSSQGRVDSESAALREAMTAAGLDADGPVALSQFDPPWVLGPFRRNEVSIPLD